MHDFTLEELEACVAVFNRAGVQQDESTEGVLMKRLNEALAERQELESMDFDDCLGGACKL